jgi:FkbM family methyltransferase
MGNGADKILDFCAGKNIKIADIFASDEFVREHSFRGFKVKSLVEIKEIYGNNFCILLSFAARVDSVIKKIYDLDDKHELYVPNFPVFGDNIYFDYDYYLKNQKEIKQTYDLLADDESKSVYENAINFNLTGKLEYLKRMESDTKSALDLLELGENLSYIDLGAYDGDTIFELLNYHKNIKNIFAFEPDIKNFSKLKKNISEYNILNICKLYNLGAWSREDILYFNARSNRNSSFNAPHNKSKKNLKEVRVNSVDNILSAQIAGEILIKYDVEGAEFEALAGSCGIIKKYSPKLIVSLYHRIDDIFKLPVYIKSLNPDYKFYLRKHKYIPCWDLNLYAVAGNI